VVEGDEVVVAGDVVVVGEVLDVGGVVVLGTVVDAVVEDVGAVVVELSAVGVHVPLGS
jgi:hypothetical protein